MRAFHKPLSPWRTPLIGENSTQISPPKPTAPQDSWWTRPVRSRREFDQLVAERSREAGWTGKSLWEDR